MPAGDVALLPESIVHPTSHGEGFEFVREHDKIVKQYKECYEAIQMPPACRRYSRAVAQHSHTT